MVHTHYKLKRVVKATVAIWFNRKLSFVTEHTDSISGAGVVSEQALKCSYSDQKVSLF